MTTHNVNKTGGGPGTNQYRVRGTGRLHVSAPLPDLPINIQVSEAPDEPDATLVEYTNALARALRQYGGNHIAPMIDMLDIPTCPPQAIRMLTLPLAHNVDANDAVIAAAVRHSACPSDVIQYAHVRKPKAQSIRMALLQREGAPLGEWQQEAKDQGLLIQIDLAVMPRCPDEIKRLVWSRYQDDFVKRNSYDVLRYVKGVTITPGIAYQIPEMIKYPYQGMPTALAQNLTCPADVLIDLLEIDDQTRAAVLANPNCPAHLKVIGTLAQ